MQGFKALLYSAMLMGLVVAPLSASSYVPVASGGSYSMFGFSGFGFGAPAPSYTPIAPPAATTPTTTTSPSTGAGSTLQTSSCLYNSCAGATPGTTSTPATTQSSFTPSRPPSTFGFGFTGSVTTYSVFGLYNFYPTTFGGTQQPVLSGGLTPSTAIGDPLANPEPTSVALFGAGLMVLGWVRRRRKNAAV